MERNQIGRGWPYFKNMAIDIQERTEAPVSIPAVSSRLPDRRSVEVTGYHDRDDYQEFEEMMESPVQGMLPQPLNDTYNEDEISFLKLAYSGMAQRLEPFAAKVLSEYEYDGSPIYDERVGKEFIEQMADRVVEYAEADVVEVQNIWRDGDYGSGGKCALLCEIAELVVLNELYWRRRPVYRRYFKA